MRVSEFNHGNDSRAVVMPRQTAMYLGKNLTDASPPEIGRQFGGKYHTRVMHSIAKIDDQCRNDKDLDRTINKLQEILNG
jgi:chromosomal replication initiator protein